MLRICHACNRPYVPQRDRDLNLSHFCPDCMPSKELVQAGTLDCQQYIRPHRVTDRLRTGFEMLAECPE